MHRAIMTRRPAFSMMELVIVMVIMGILAAIAIPRISTAVERAKAEAVEASLSQVRNSIEVYKAEHEGRIPDKQFEAQMTQYSNVQGETDTSLSSKFPLGPYLREIPKNPYSGSTAIRFLMTAGPSQAAGSKNLGWTYNTATGEFAADCSDTQLTVDVQAIPLNKL